jgi:hypothetical protein
MELKTREFVFQLSDLRIVSIHPFAGTIQVLVHMVYNKSRIPEHHEPFYAELDGDTKAVESRLILNGIIGCFEVDPEDIAQPIPRWQDEIHPCPGTVDIEGAVKIHIPVLGGVVRDRCIHICPFDNEVEQRL